MTTARDIENRLPITAAMILSTLMNTLDSTIANVALPHIQGSVSAAQDQITWVLTSYIIAAAVMTPLAGWLSQKIGRKRMFLLSIAGFTVASMLCGIATSLPEIVFFRMLQGAAGAAMMPLSQTVMLDLFPPRLLPVAMSAWSAAIMVGPILGPVLGGWLTEDFSWRWVFYINVPIGILSFWGLAMFMDNDEGGRQRPFDFLGFGSLITFVFMFQLMTDRGPSQDWFSSPEIWTELAISVGALWMFIVQTITAEHPFFHRDLARDTNFVTTTMFSFVVAALLFSTTALLPSMMQNLLGYSALQAGYASMPRGLGTLIAFVLVPFALRIIGPRLSILIGLILSITAVSLMTRFDLSMTAASVMTSGFIQGLGVGFLFTPLTTLAYVTLHPTHRTEGTIVSTMARGMGSSLGISTMQALLVRHAAQAHAALAAHIQPGDPVIAAALPSALSPTSGAGLQALNGEITRQGAMIGYDWVFGLVVIMTLALFPMLAVLRPAPPVRQVEFGQGAE